VCSSDLWLLDAECQLRAGNLGEARARFDALRTSEPKSQAAETALFQAANLAVRMRDNGVALTLLTDYTSQYPNGLYHFAALERRCEVLLGNNALTEARQCLQSLQARYPTQSRAQDALLLLARLASREGRDAECVELLTAYLEEHPRSSHDADARLEQVRCARRAHHAEVDRFVREYLERYPDGRLEAPAHKDALP
jgi:TolA-binding protein